mmetsp:Transcript_16905/g.36867  ORF Transcript_16905/g.36867 Transcript_16905/m.36867 type:complete len:316 (+) Transcript_16905:835-1782(+)
MQIIHGLGNTECDFTPLLEFEAFVLLLLGRSTAKESRAMRTVRVLELFRLGLFPPVNASFQCIVQSIHHDEESAFLARGNTSFDRPGRNAVELDNVGMIQRLQKIRLHGQVGRTVFEMMQVHHGLAFQVLDRQFLIRVGMIRRNYQTLIDIGKAAFPQLVANLNILGIEIDKVRLSLGRKDSTVLLQFRHGIAGVVRSDAGRAGTHAAVGGAGVDALVPPFARGTVLLLRLFLFVFVDAALFRRAGGKGGTCGGCGVDRSCGGIVIIVIIVVLGWYCGLPEGILFGAGCYHCRCVVWRCCLFVLQLEFAVVGFVR